MTEQGHGKRRDIPSTDIDPIQVIEDAIKIGDQATIERIVHELRTDPHGTNLLGAADKQTS
jgi:hypothetical protein